MKVKALENTLEGTPSPVSAPLKGLGSGSLPGTCGFVSGSHVIKSTPAFLFPRYEILSFPPLFFFFKSLSRVRLFATPWTIQSMEFSRPEYWSGWPSPSPGDLPNSGVTLVEFRAVDSQVQILQPV